MAEYSLAGKRLSFGRTLSEGVGTSLADEKSLAVFTSGGDAQVARLNSLSIKAKGRYCIFQPCLGWGIVGLTSVQCSLY